MLTNSGHSYNGIPIMGANMDTVGTFEMAKAMAKVRYLYTSSLSVVIWTQ